MGRNMQGPNNPNWKGGISRDYYRYKKIQIERYPERVRARRLAYQAFKAGKIPKQPCEVCGDPNSQMHHDDYSKPYEVRWLCPKHHKRWHENQRGTGKATVNKEEKNNDHRVKVK